MDYTEIGFSKSFLRQPPRNEVDSDSLTDFSTHTIESIFQTFSASKLSGGIIKSNDGKLEINLDSGTLTYNDGVVDLLSLGGSNASLTIRDRDENTLITS